MSSYGTLSYCATPKGLANTRGRCPHPRSPRGRGAGKTSCTLTTERCRLQPVKAKLQAVASQALTGFQLHPLRIVLLLSRRWRGVKGGEAVHFTLDALEPTQHFATGSGGWVLTACPAAPQVRLGFGAKPQGVDTRKASMYCACVYRKYRVAT